MGHIIKTNEQYEFRQDNGETTAWFSQTDEKMELVHPGHPEYKKIFYILISIALVYLIFVFAFVR